MKKKPIATLLLLFSLLHCPLVGDEVANPAGKLLREALFAEQADRDIAKAEKGYRTIIKNFETDRAYAATAILRLAEILHERGDTAEAEKWFARILQEFPDQKDILKVATARLGDKAAKFLGALPDRINPQTEEVERLARILEQSPDLLNTPKDGTTLLATAASKGNLEVVEYLLTKGARIESNAKVPSALTAAVKNGHFAVVARLLKAEAKIEKGLLHMAVQSGNYAISELLLKAGVDPNTLNVVRLSPEDFDQPSPGEAHPGADPFAADPFGDDNLLERNPEDTFPSHPEVTWTPLEVATFYRFTKLTDLLLANGAKPQKYSATDSEIPVGFTEDLRFAIVDQNVKLVAKLLKHGADPNSQWSLPQERLSALSIAASAGNAEIVEQLIKAGAKVNHVESKYKYTPLYYANGPAVGVLLAAGADPNADIKRGHTPLHEVTDPAKAKALLAAGADLNAITESGYSPIAFAHFKVLDVLLAEKPDLTRLEGPHTALGHASGRSRDPFQVKRIEKLIAAGSDPNQIDKNGMTPLMIAVSNFNADSVKALIAGGAKPNGVPNSPAPLTILPSVDRRRSSKYGPVVRALVDAGADPNVLDSNNETILRKVAKANDLETIRYLLKKGAAPQIAGKFAFNEAPDRSTTKAELFLATYLQAERRRGMIRIVVPEMGRISDEVSAFVPDAEKLPECPYTILEAYAFSSENDFSFGKVTIWREGKVEPLKVDLRRIIASGDPAQDLKLEWGDLIQFSTAKSREEASVTETEKKFLEGHLNRRVKFSLEGETNQVHLTLDCAQLPDTDLWIVRKLPTQSNYVKEFRTFPLMSVKDLKLFQQSNVNSERHLLETQIVQRGVRKVDIPGVGISTLWFEPDDIVFLKKRKR